MAAAGFLSGYLSGPLPYVRRHITVNKMLSASLNKAFPSFLNHTFSISIFSLGSNDWQGRGMKATCEHRSRSPSTWRRGASTNPSQTSRRHRWCQRSSVSLWVTELGDYKIRILMKIKFLLLILKKLFLIYLLIQNLSLLCPTLVIVFRTRL